MKAALANLALAAALLLAGDALALDPPHDMTRGIHCLSCHMPHQAPGGAVTAVAGNPNLCMSCHNPAGPAAARPFATSDQALPGTSGTSHRWDSGPSGYIKPSPANQGDGAVESAGAFSGRIERTYTLSITATGDAGVATYTWVDSTGASGGGITGSDLALNAGLTVAFRDGALDPLTPQSFLAGDVFTLRVRTDLRWPADPSIAARMDLGGGKTICSACHNQHSQSNQPFDPDAPPYAGSGTGEGRHYQRIANDRAEMCRDCHQPRDVTAASAGSHPVGVAIPAGDFQVPANLVLDPDAQVQCLTCHTPHFTSSGGANSGQGDGYLLNRSIGSLCGECHTLADAATGSHFSTTTGALWPGGQYGSTFPAHSAEKRGACVNCHWPHGWPDDATPANDYPKLWVERYDVADDRSDAADSEDLCYTCHDAAPAQTNIRADLLKGTNGTNIFHHPVMDTEQSAGRSVECVDCHNPHQATSANRLAGTTGVDLAGIPVGPGTGNVRPTTQYEVCFKCHGDSWNSARPRSSNKRLDFQTDSSNAAYHPVVQPGRGQSANLAAQLLGGLTTSSTLRCIDCHNSDATGAVIGPVVDTPALTQGPHGSTNAIILRANFGTTYTSQGWNDNNATLCFRCHSSTALLSRRRSDGARTNFYNSSRDNLHWYHLTDKSTTASCLSCHFDLHSNRSAANTQYRARVGGVWSAWASTPPASVKSHLVNFAPDVQGTGGNPPRWQIDTGTGSRSCYVTCHGGTMNPQSYGPSTGDETSHVY